MPFVGGQSHERQRNGRLFAAAGYARAGTGHRSGSALQPMVVGLTGLLPEQVHPRWQSTVPRQWPVPTDWCAVGVMRIQPDANPVCVHEGAEEGTERWMRDETLDVLCSFYGSHGMQYASRL